MGPQKREVGQAVIQLTVDDYLTRFGEAVDDTTLTGSADGDRITRARALGQINISRRAVFRELLAAGIVESRLSERVAITADATDADMFALPKRRYRLIGIFNAEDKEYPSVYSRHRNRQAGYLVEGNDIRWFIMDPPDETLYAVVIREPATLSTGTAAAGTTTSLTLATAPTVGRNIQEDDYLNGCKVGILSGTGALQTSTITDYTSALVATCAWTVAPSTDSVYSIMENMPSCIVDAVVLRAAHNLSRFDAEFDHVINRLYGEAVHAYNSALMELQMPSSESAEQPRQAERFGI